MAKAKARHCPRADPLQLAEFVSWLNPRGTRDNQLLKTFRMWMPELEGGMRRRRTTMGLDKGAEEEEGARRRPQRRVAGGEEEGFMGWRVSLGPSCTSLEGQKLTEQNKRAT